MHVVGLVEVWGLCKIRFHYGQYSATLSITSSFWPPQQCGSSAANHFLALAGWCLVEWTFSGISDFFIGVKQCGTDFRDWISWLVENLKCLCLSAWAWFERTFPNWWKLSNVFAMFRNSCWIVPYGKWVHNVSSLLMGNSLMSCFRKQKLHFLKNSMAFVDLSD